MSPMTEAREIATRARKRELEIRRLQALQMEDKQALGKLVARIRTDAGISQRGAAEILKRGGVNPLNITAIEKPSARRSHSVITMMRAARAFTTGKHEWRWHATGAGMGWVCNRCDGHYRFTTDENEPPTTGCKP